MKKNDFRQMVADQFVRVLEESPKDWKKNWTAGETGWPVNAATNKAYKGINLFYLKHMEVRNGYEDNRWATFKQIQDKGWKLRRGSKGEKVEYWVPYDHDLKKNIPWSEARDLFEEHEITIHPRYYTVFNASCIEGIPEKAVKANHNDIHPDQFIRTISNNMGVEILNDGGGQAFYSVREDKIHLPLSEHFDDDYSYSSTALHELGHATGHGKRLNRDLSGDNYAYEELVAEITSCFMSEHLTADMSEEHFENHKAYVQGWASRIKDDAAFLIDAVKDAAKAADFLELNGGLISQKEYERKENKVLSVSSEKVQQSVPAYDRLPKGKQEVLIEPTITVTFSDVDKIKKGTTMSFFRADQLFVSIEAERIEEVREICGYSDDIMISCGEISFSIDYSINGKTGKLDWGYEMTGSGEGIISQLKTHFSRKLEEPGYFDIAKAVRGARGADYVEEEIRKSKFILNELVPYLEQYVKQSIQKEPPEKVQQSVPAFTQGMFPEQKIMEKFTGKEMQSEMVMEI